MAVVGVAVAAPEYVPLAPLLPLLPLLLLVLLLLLCPISCRFPFVTTPGSWG